MPYPEDQITTVNQLLASERDKTELRNSLSVDGMREIIENRALSVNDLLIHKEEDVSVLSTSFARQLVAAYNTIRNSEAFLSGAVSLRDMMITSQVHGHTDTSVLSTSFARQAAENPARLQEIRNMAADVPEGMAHHIGHGAVGFFNNQQQAAVVLVAFPVVQRPEVTHVSRLAAAGYSGEIQPEFICPITNEIMDDPVSIPGSYQYFERSALHQWLNSRATNPLNPSQEIALEDIQTATAIHNQINEFVDSVSPPPPQQRV